MAAAFFLFSTVGLQSSLSNRDSTHMINGFGWAVTSGLVAIAYVVVTSRKPLFIPVVVIGQIIAMKELGRFLAWINESQPAVPLENIVHLYSLVSMLSTGAAYGLFLIFINSEGRFAFRAQTELALAHGIQQTLAPVVHLVAGGCELYGISAPSDKVGGDLVDVVALPDGGAIAYIADVAGHGLQAGILMGMVKTAVRTALLDNATLPDLFDRLNRVLPAVKEANMYATSAALVLQPSIRGSGAPQGCSVEYALAGHPPILHVSALARHGDLLSDEQFPLGLLPIASYRSQTTQAAKGDLFVITTDGILEVCNGKDVEFGMEGLQAIVAGHMNEPLPGLAVRILEAARLWGRQEDDQTLLLIRVL
jgi:serine phosphatase RsbU (regulator of sigma subunit)